MARLDDTAYPRLKRLPTPSGLAAAYTPTWDEVIPANTTARGTAARVCILILLKTYQRLGYPVLLADVPTAVVAHIARSAGVTNPVSMAGYDASGTRQRHLIAIRAYVQVSPWGAVARRVLLGALREAARTKNDLADLINVGLEELVHQRYELPALAAAQLFVRAQQTLDDLDTMFTRQMRRNHHDGKEALAAYRAEAAPRTDALVGTLRDLVVAHGQDGMVAQRFAAMDAVIGQRGDVLVEERDLHLAHAGSNYYPFLWRPYRSHRTTLFA